MKTKNIEERTNHRYRTCALPMVILIASVVAVGTPVSTAAGKANAPSITFSNVKVTAVRDTSVIIRWETNAAATGQVEYGLNTKYGKLTGKQRLSYWHCVEVTDIRPGTTYHYRIRAKDYKGRETISKDHTFTTGTRKRLNAIIRAARRNKDLPKTYYVKPAGNDKHDGLSIKTAWATPSHAALKAEAGDTIYLLDGTWKDEHIVFTNSGIDVAPITMKTYSGRPTLNGNDKSGHGIDCRKRDYISISGLTIHHYALGINGSGGIQKNISRCVIHDCGSKGDQVGIQLYKSHGSIVDRCEIYSNGMGIISGSVNRLAVTNNYIHKCHGPRHGGITIKNDSSNILIANNRIIDGINPKGGGPNCIHLVTWDQSTYNRRVVIRGNVLRGCGHNGIDLHQNFHDVLVINNDVSNARHQQCIYVTDGPKNWNIYIVNNKIHDGINGIFVPDVDGVWVEGNTVYNCEWGLRLFHQGYWDGRQTYWSDKPDDYTSDNHTVIGNTLYSNKYGIAIGGSNNDVLENNKVYDSRSADYHIGGGCTDTTIRNMPVGSNRICLFRAKGSEVAIEFTDGRVFSVKGAKETPFWYPDGSKFHFRQKIWSKYESHTYELTSYNMTAVPAKASADIIVNSFSTTSPKGDILVDFTAKTTDGNNVVFTIGDLRPGDSYRIKKDGEFLITKKADEKGFIKFNHSRWSKERTFAVEGKATPSGNISGKVIDKQTGKPIEGAEVRKEGKPVLTDKSGKYLIARVLVGRYRMTASKKGYISASRSVTVVSGKTIKVDFRLARPGRRKGKKEGR